MKKTKSTKKEKDYQASYRKSKPLLSTHVPKGVYEEVKKRAADDKRSVDQWLSLFLEWALASLKRNKASVFTVESHGAPIMLVDESDEEP